MMVIKTIYCKGWEENSCIRPPYMIYGDDDVEGKAVSKDEVTK